MQSFKTIHASALKGFPNESELEAALPRPVSGDKLAAHPDAWFLSRMSFRVFATGLKHSMVEAKWPAFEEVFMGFEPTRITAMNDEALEALLNEKRIIRHWGKIRATRDNAAAMQEITREHGGMGRFLAAWPTDDIVGLWDELTRRFRQLGGNSGPYFLRMVGKDTFILTPDVVKALNERDAVSGSVKNKGDRRKAQAAFNAWAEESGWPLCQISRLLALSVGR